MHQTTPVHTRSAHRKLVFTTSIGENTAQQPQRRLVQRLGQIDQPAPAIRVLQRGHPAQTPHLGLHRIHR
ncbi:hypothetical protein, partial [Streptomyces sp. NPDC004728]|uniref:hypothetical protein n=1 Tax=Streptomyces sp. NPDC004728 TaxID=3154289 RepID=UPI0033B49CAB